MGTVSKRSSKSQNRTSDREEKSGYFLQHLEGRYGRSPGSFSYKPVGTRQPFVHQGTPFLMQYDHVENLSDYVNKVAMELI